MKARAAPFEAKGRRGRRLAFRMLGSLADADDMVQEAWLRLGRTMDDPDGTAAANLPAWLTTVTTPLANDEPRSRRRRAEEPLAPMDGAGAAASTFGADPEAKAILAQEVCLAFLVVLDRLQFVERLAFVLHDLSMLHREPDASISAAAVDLRSLGPDRTWFPW